MRHTIQVELMAESQNRNLSVRLDGSRLSLTFLLPENFTNAINKARRIVHLGAGNLLQCAEFHRQNTNSAALQP